MVAKIRSRADEARSLALKGIPKSLKTRAAMHASRLCRRIEEPDRWLAFYYERLRELESREKTLALISPD